MKKIIALILALILSSLTLLSCNGYYPPKESTKKESTVVMTLAFGEETYEIKYELYRALFLTLRHDVDKGDSSVWQGAKKGEYVDEINKLIFARLGDIYAVFSLAKEIGVDVYSEEYDETVLEIIKASVDSESIGEVKYTGFGGDYDAYLDSLKEMNLNYSVQDLMIRYALAMEDIHYYYGGNVENDANLGKLGYTREDVLAFYNSDECVRVYQLFLSSLRTSYDKDKAENLRDKIASRDSEEAVIESMIGNSTLGEDIKNGEIIGMGKHEHLMNTCNEYKEISDSQMGGAFLD